MSSLRLISLLVLISASAPAAPSGAVIREPGVIYLEDLLQKPVYLFTSAETPIYYQSDLGRYLGVMKKGQRVELQAVGDGVYRVRGMAQQGQVAGWVEPATLTPLKPQFLSALKQNATRRDEVNELIARNEVAINMTAQEVLTSLGKPAKTTSRLDAQGREEIWEFVRFDRVPQTMTAYDAGGRLVSRTVYVKVPAGKLAVIFTNDLVSALEQSEGTLSKEARPKIVAAPFTVVY
jgi:hypothetical protein